MATLSHDIQSLLTILCTSLYAARQEDTLVQEAASIFCREQRNQIEACHPSDSFFREVTALGNAIVEEGFPPIASLQGEDVLMPYAQQ